MNPKIMTKDNSSDPARETAFELQFPALEALIAGDKDTVRDVMRARLARTAQALERVIRQGNQADAVRAQLAWRAWHKALSFLDEIENEMSRTSAPEK